jgi:hypothetical protein
MKETNEGKFTWSSMLHKFELLIKGDGLSIFPLSIFVVGIVVAFPILIFAYFFRDSSYLLAVLILAVLYLLYRVIMPVVGIFNYIVKNKPFMMLPRDTMLSGYKFDLSYGDKFKPNKEISAEKSYTLEALKSEKLTLKEGEVIPKLS